MVKQGVEEQIYSCIDNKKSFIVEAGAGSGKTWTLVQSLLYIIERYGDTYKRQNKKVACITYTRVAKEEIIERIEDNNLIIVNTIHEFLWDIIKQFNKELKYELLFYIGEKLKEKQIDISKCKKTTTATYAKLDETIRKYTEVLEELKDYSGKIEYRERASWRKGVISHDEMLQIATCMIGKYSMLQKLIEDSYPIIFIDEYQDTSEKLATVILDELVAKSSIIFGFFGDYMQQIYTGSIGKMDTAKYKLESIPKIENYRCSKEVIDLLNKLRDDIQQEQRGEIKYGQCKVYYINNEDFETEEFIEKNIRLELDLDREEKFKKLYLVTRSIARQNGYLGLHDLYDEKKKVNEHRHKKNKDYILKNKDNRECPLANFLYDIKEVIELYEKNKIQLLLEKIEFKLESIEDKVELKQILDELCKKADSDIIGDVISYVCSNNILEMPLKVKEYFTDDNLQDDFFKGLMSIEFLQFKRLWLTNEESSPFTTNHGTKGSEFDNVVCIINDKDWNQYSFDKYLSQESEGKDIYNRTRNLFYVICSRAKYNLILLFLSELSEGAKQKLKLLVSEDNFMDMSLDEMEISI